MNDNNKWPLRYDLLLRYRVIEIIALWEGRLTTKHLCNTFGIGRQQASKDINLYNHEVAPGNLEYDKFLKGYKPTVNFKPEVTTGTADEYLYLLNRNNTLSSTFESLNLSYANTQVLQVPIRDIKPEILRPLVQAARTGKRVEVEYVSLRSPEVEIRVIAPHTLVHTGMRWHVRAYCEKRKTFIDFVLSRFRGEPDIMDDSPNTIEDDTDWNNQVMIRIKPDSRLNAAQQNVVENDFGMTDGILEIPIRASLISYALRLLQIDPHTNEASQQKRPEDQQIVIDNLEALREWIF